jgi:hypothetical protein
MSVRALDTAVSGGEYGARLCLGGDTGLSTTSLSRISSLRRSSWYAWKTFSSQGPSLTLLLTTLRQSLLKCSLCAYQADWELQGLPTPTQPTILAHLLPIRHPSMRGWGRGLGKTHLALTLRPVLQSYTSYSLLQRLPYLLPITIPITIPTVSTIDTRRGWGPGWREYVNTFR